LFERWKKYQIPGNLQFPEMFLGSKFLQKFSHTSFDVANSENYTDKISKLLNTGLLIPNKSTGGPKKNCTRLFDFM
jgi:hypothetical protein